MTDEGLDPTTPAEPEPPEPEPPPHREADVLAADGGTLHLRPIRGTDADALVTFHGGLSMRTRYLRFFSAYPRIPPRDLHRFTHVDHHDREALIAELAGQIVAVGRYERAPGTDQAEVAFVVADAHQGRGIGPVLLEHLAAAARESGLRRFQAVVLAENAPMMRVFREAGYAATRHLDYGEVTLEFAVDETALTEAVMREREQRAESRSIRRLLHPASVAVVGASNDPGKVGHAIFANLVRMGFTGALFPVNRDTAEVGGRPAFTSVLDLPTDVDLAVVAVPAAQVPAVVEQCGRRGVRGLIVVAGGYGERGTPDEQAAGRLAQRDLVVTARARGMRVVGPNCLGIINTDPAVRLNASLAPLAPRAGRIGFFCQSGALGVAVLGEAARRGLGVATFVSAGNRADVSGNDLLQYWETDDATDLVLMYLESFGNPRKFARLSRRLGRRKPIVAVNSAAGAVVAGLQSTSVEVPEVALRALFEAAGVIRVDTVGDMFDVALLLASQPLPAGARVGVVGNSAALALLVANACRADGLMLTRSADVGVDTAPAAFAAALVDVLAAPDVDAVVVVFVPPLLRDSADEVAGRLRDLAAAAPKPVLSTFLGFDGVPEALAVAGDTAPARGSVPSYPSPERAVRALARAVRYADWRSRPIGTVPDLPRLDLAAARELIEADLAADPGRHELSTAAAARLLAAVGVAVGPEVPVAAVAVELAVHDNPALGALASFGIAGVAIELLDDRAYATVPLTAEDADALIMAPRAAPLLTGYRGSEPCDRLALSDLALRLSALAESLPELVECTLAVLAAPIGAYVQSATVTLAAPPTGVRRDTGPRRIW